MANPEPPDVPDVPDVPDIPDIPETPKTPQTPDNSPNGAACALNNHLDTRTAATETAAELQEKMGQSTDLLFVFASYHHRAGMADACEILRNTLNPKVLMGTTCECVLGNEIEFEGRAGLSAIAFRFNDTKINSFKLQPGEEVTASDTEAMRELLGCDESTKAIIMLADPFSTPTQKLLPLMGSCVEGKSIPITGGLASGASHHGQNLLVLNDEHSPHGIVGVSISGRVGLDFIVSQGCRPVGTPLVVTKAERNVINELGGKPAMQAVQEIAESLEPEERELLSKGILLGVVIDEYKDRFGRGDFLIRNTMGYDQKTGSMAVSDVIPVGRTIQLQARDATTATEDLQLLLDGSN